MNNVPWSRTRSIPAPKKPIGEKERVWTVGMGGSYECPYCGVPFAHSHSADPEKFLRNSRHDAYTVEYWLRIGSVNSFRDRSHFDACIAKFREFVGDLRFIISNLLEERKSPRLAILKEVERFIAAKGKDEVQSWVESEICKLESKP